MSIRQKSIDVIVRKIETGFRVQMDGRPGKKVFACVEDAKKLVFEVIENGKAQEYLDKCKGTVAD